MSGPRFLSLFAGIGGFDLGLERAGFLPAGQIEIEPFCQRVLTARWPGVERAEDIRTWQPRGDGGRRPDESLPLEGRPGGDDECERTAGLLAPRREDAVGRIDLLTGGFPCQDVSVAGKRAGLSGERSGLFWEIVRIAKVTRPTWGLFENVPGLLSSHSGRDMWTVLQGLRECWPAVGYRILDSRYFGVAQRRRRVFFVCGPTEAGVAEVLALTEGGAGDLEAGGEAGAAAPAAVVASTLNSGGNSGGFRTEPGEHLVSHALSAGKGNRFGSGRDGQDDFVVTDPLSTKPHADNEAQHRKLVVGQCHGSNVGEMGTLRKGDGGVTSGVPFVFEPKASSHQSMNPNSLAPALGTTKEPAVYTHALTGEGHDASEDGTRRGTPLVAFDTTQITSKVNRSSPKPGDPCHPLAAGAHPPAITGSAVRRLTPVECEKLQAFPPGWTCLCTPLAVYAEDEDTAALACTCPDSPRYRALGNAVTVSVVTWLGRRLKEVLHALPDQR